MCFQDPKMPILCKWVAKTQVFRLRGVVYMAPNTVCDAASDKQ